MPKSEPENNMNDPRTGGSQFHIGMLTGAVCLTCFVLIWLGYHAYTRFQADRQDLERAAQIAELRGTITHLDEVLSMSARMAVATGDQKWEQRYRIFKTRLDAAIKKARTSAPEAFRGEAAAATQTAVEDRLFDLVRRGRVHDAQQILDGAAYNDQKQVYVRGMTRSAATSRIAVRLAKLRGMIIHMDEVLTMSARMAATTGDLRWEDRYRRFEPRLDAAIKEARAIAPQAASRSAAESTDHANVELVKLENRAFDLVRENRLPEAQAILFSEAYDALKSTYADGMNEFAGGMMDLVDRQVRSASIATYLNLFAVVLVVGMLIAGWLYLLNRTRRWHGMLVNQAIEMAAMNLNLDSLVDERTRELEQSRKHAVEMMEEANETRQQVEQINEKLRRTSDRLQHTSHGLEEEIKVRKEVEKRALEHQAELAHVARLTTVGEMASGLSHELNQPLTAIVNYTGGCLNRMGAGNINQAELVETMRLVARQAERAGGIIRRIREFSKKGDANRSMLDINDVVGNVIELAERETRKKNARLDVKLASKLPPIFGDEIQLEQVLLNLVRNAFDAVAEVDFDAGQVPAVGIRTLHSNDTWVEVTVTDNGQGFQGDQVNRIFHPFYTTKEGGMGLGLAISRSIMDTHDGKIWAEPNPGGGATFHVACPVPVEKGGSPGRQNPEEQRVSREFGSTRSHS